MYSTYSPHCFHEHIYQTMYNVHTERVATNMMVKNEDDVLASPLSSTELLPIYIYGSQIGFFHSDGILSSLTHT